MKQIAFIFFECNLFRGWGRLGGGGNTGEHYAAEKLQQICDSAKIMTHMRANKL